MEPVVEYQRIRRALSTSFSLAVLLAALASKTGRAGQCADDVETLFNNVNLTSAYLQYFDTMGVNVLGQGKETTRNLRS